MSKHPMLAWCSSKRAQAVQQRLGFGREVPSRGTHGRRSSITAQVVRVPLTQVRSSAVFYHASISSATGVLSAYQTPAESSYPQQ